MGMIVRPRRAGSVAFARGCARVKKSQIIADASMSWLASEIESANCSGVSPSTTISGNGLPGRLAGEEVDHRVPRRVRAGDPATYARCRGRDRGRPVRRSPCTRAARPSARTASRSVRPRSRCVPRSSRPTSSNGTCSELPPPSYGSSRSSTPWNAIVGTRRGGGARSVGDVRGDGRGGRDAIGQLAGDEVGHRAAVGEAGRVDTVRDRCTPSVRGRRAVRRRTAHRRRRSRASTPRRGGRDRRPHSDRRR